MKRKIASRKAPPSAAFGEAMHAAIRAQSVLVEDLQSKIELVLEAVTGSRESLERSMHELEARLSARIDVLERVVRQNSEDIRKNSEDIRKNSADIQKNSEDIRKNSE